LYIYLYIIVYIFVVKAVVSFIVISVRRATLWNMLIKPLLLLLYKKLDTNSCFAKLRTISSLFSIFYTPCIVCYATTSTLPPLCPTVAPASLKILFIATIYKAYICSYFCHFDWHSTKYGLDCTVGNKDSHH
jgi:hypothetical protein